MQISPEKVCFVIMKSREFDAKDFVTDAGSNASDDDMVAVLEDHPDDPCYDEVTSFIDALSDDEQVDLVALAWLGRGDYTADDWQDVREDAQCAHNERTAGYLLGMPLLSDYLEEGLLLLGQFCEEYEINRL